MKQVTTTPDGRVRVRTINNEATRTQQHHKDACDVNKIIAKYKNTGEFLHLTSKQGVYADVSGITDYQESIHKVMNAQAAFAALPSNVRLRFQNDPGELLRFIQDPKNRDEAMTLGLLEKPKQVVNPRANDFNDSPQSTTTQTGTNQQTPPPQTSTPAPQA